MTGQDTGLDPDDRVALADLVARYAALVDERRFADLGELFSSDAVLVTPDPPKELAPVVEHVGRPAVVAALEHVSAVPLTRHTVSGQVVEPDDLPGNARGRVVGSAHHLSERPDGDITDLVWHVRYQDSYRFDAGAWRFTRRELSVDWVEVRPARHRLLS